MEFGFRDQCLYYHLRHRCPQNLLSVRRTCPFFVLLLVNFLLFKQQLCSIFTFESKICFIRYQLVAYAVQIVLSLYRIFVPFFLLFTLGSRVSLVLMGPCALGPERNRILEELIDGEKPTSAFTRFKNFM